jgi:hypothetical protein
MLTISATPAARKGNQNRDDLHEHEGEDECETGVQGAGPGMAQPDVCGPESQERADQKVDDRGAVECGSRYGRGDQIDQ